MTAVSRSAQFNKLYKVLKKHYKAPSALAERPVLEHLLFACCLEDARREAAEEAYAALVHTFFDWNEIRVTSISELAEVMAALPDPRAAANRVKRVLHAVFEGTYAFDLEDKRKKTLGPTLKWFEKLDGTTRFSVAYVTQAALGGHSIPIDTGTMTVLGILGLVSDKDAAEGVVPGLERAIPKNKGVEFGALLHQLGADFTANPFSAQVRDILLQVEPEAKSRFPQRRAARPPASVPEPPAKKKGEGKSADTPAPASSKKAEAAKNAEATKAATPAKPADAGKPAATGKKPAAPEPTPPKKKNARPAETEKEKSTAAGLSKRKPR
jgi:endonuclease III